jgi:3'-phosphoadenosine 5'-phosphosulfate (PAPS) 3'-phosphatase
MTQIKKWDLCAPDAVLRAHHGTMTTLTNQTISYDHLNKNMLITDGILATYKKIHNDLLKFLSRFKSDQIYFSREKEIR